jgi:valyl-tRNA synthetase
MSLLKRVHAFAKASEDIILNQLRRMGSSLDWSRYAYTIDAQAQQRGDGGVCAHV